MKKASIDQSQATQSLDVEALEMLCLEVPGVNVAAFQGEATTLKGDDPELFPPELLQRTSCEQEKGLKDDKAKHPQGPSRSTDDGLELSFPPNFSPDRPGLASRMEVPSTKAIPEAVAASHQPGVEHVSGMPRTVLSAHDVDGVVNLPRDQQTRSMHHLIATLVEPAPIAEVQPAPIAEVISDSELKSTYQCRSCMLLWMGGFIVVAVVVTSIVLAKQTGQDSPIVPAAPLAIAPSMAIAPSISPILNPTLEALIPFLPSSSQAEIVLPGTPQYQALEWLSGNVGVETLPVYRIIQRYALATLYYATNGTGWNSHFGWLGNGDECNWYSNSITHTICKNGVLITLYIASNRLSGVLPPDISMLSNLNDLYLYNNALNGTIPSSLGQLTNLSRNAKKGVKHSFHSPPCGIAQASLASCLSPWWHTCHFVTRLFVFVPKFIYWDNPIIIWPADKSNYLVFV